MQQSKFIYFRKQSLKRDENTPPSVKDLVREFYFVVIRFPVFISRIFNPLDLSLCWGQSHSRFVQIYYTPVFGLLVFGAIWLFS